MSQIVELYGTATTNRNADWPAIEVHQYCPYLKRQCTKVRKSQPEQTIGSCSVMYGHRENPIMICPHRFLERGQIFMDCLHLLTRHEPGNQVHVVPEIAVPGGSVDYFLVSAKGAKVQDFVGIELQTLDTTGTIWPLRQNFLGGVSEGGKSKGFGMNWKMTTKTTLVQLNHKIKTFADIGKILVLVLQDDLMTYMQTAFQFDHLNKATLGDPMHFHVYSLDQASSDSWQIGLRNRLSTDSEGIARSLGLRANPRLEIEYLIGVLETKISNSTLFRLI